MATALAKMISSRRDIEAWLGELRDGMKRVAIGSEGEVFSVHDRAEALEYYEGCCALIRFIRDIADEQGGGVKIEGARHDD